MNGIDDTVTVITGAASGIGREVAADLARHGARIAAVDIDPDGLATTTHRLEAEGHKAHTFTTDITDDDGVVVATVRKQIYVRRKRDAATRTAVR